MSLHNIMIFISFLKFTFILETKPYLSPEFLSSAPLFASNPPHLHDVFLLFLLLLLTLPMSLFLPMLWLLLLLLLATTCCYCRCLCFCCCRSRRCLCYCHCRCPYCCCRCCETCKLFFMHMKIYSNLVIYVNKEKIHLPPPHSDETTCYIQPAKARLVRVDYRGGETYCHL